MEVSDYLIAGNRRDDVDTYGVARWILSPDRLTSMRPQGEVDYPSVTISLPFAVAGIR